MSSETTPYELGKHPDMAPPATTVGVIGWLRANLFSSWVNSLLTLFALYLVYLIVPPVISWVFLDSTLSGETRDSCTGDGACWVFIKMRFAQFMYGFYPEVERWRINFAALLLIA